ncbi:MAG TPA: hypothetical protein VKZ44_08915 [Taishania sp.]|nr:hypothetical protein [Taishania sp.]
MQKIVFGFICILLFFQVKAQTFTIKKTIQPFYDIIEWKGMGGILMSKDPNGNSNQIYLTLVGEKDKSIWDQQIAPPNGKFHYISSENARYVYFLRNLNPENGKIYFDQLNSAGNVKNTSVSIASVIKNLGYDVSELELKNVVVTDKALVHQFRHINKKDKIQTEIATFITHHNLIPYAVVLGKVKEDEIKAGKSNSFQYIGFSGDEICFADYTHANTSKGWNVIVFNSKGQEQKRVFLKNTWGNLTTFNVVGFGTTGAFYLNTLNDVQQGLLTYINNQFYMTFMNSSSSENSLELYKLEEESWKKINNFSFQNSNQKKGFSIGIYPLNEAITYSITGISNDKKTVALPIDGSKAIVNNYTNSIIFNPSRTIISDKKEFFAVTLQTGNLFFDKNQLKTVTDVEFEFIKK